MRKGKFLDKGNSDLRTVPWANVRIYDCLPQQQARIWNVSSHDDDFKNQS
jgi:hypothetical protein